MGEIGYVSRVKELSAEVKKKINSFEMLLSEIEINNHIFKNIDNHVTLYIDKKFLPKLDKLTNIISSDLLECEVLFMDILNNIEDIKNKIKELQYK